MLVPSGAVICKMCINVLCFWICDVYVLEFTPINLSIGGARTPTSGLQRQPAQLFYINCTVFNLCVTTVFIKIPQKRIETMYMQKKTMHLTPVWTRCNGVWCTSLHSATLLRCPRYRGARTGGVVGDVLGRHAAQPSFSTGSHGHNPTHPWSYF